MRVLTRNELCGIIIKKMIGGANVKKTKNVMPVANEDKSMQVIFNRIMALPQDEIYLCPMIDSYSKDRTEEIIRNAQQQYSGGGSRAPSDYQHSRRVLFQIKSSFRGDKAFVKTYEEQEKCIPQRRSATK